MLDDIQYNLYVRIAPIDRVTFTHPDVLGQIEKYGIAIHAAKKHFECQMHVTTEDKLMQGNKGESKALEAELDIGANIEGLETIGRIRAGELPKDVAEVQAKARVQLKIHGSSNSTIEIWLEGKRLYAMRQE